MTDAEPTGEVKTINNLDLENAITFRVDSDNWIMRIENSGKISFNREKYPDSTPDDFAKAVIEILEKSFAFKNEKENL